MYAPSTLPKADIPAVVIEIIVERLSPNAIYVFGNHSSTHGFTGLFSGPVQQQLRQHFDLLVLANYGNDNAAADISDIISERTQQRVSVSLLLHKPAELRQRPGNQQYFFYTVLQKARCVFVDEETPPYLLLDTVPKRDLVSALECWQNHEAIAALFIEAAETTARLDVERVRLSLLHTAAEHIALGMIRIGLAYKPNHFGLGFLFGLCEHFSTLTATLFPRDSEEGKRLFGLLATHPAGLRHTKILHTDEADFAVLLHRCKKLLTAATLWSQSELGSFELHYSHRQTKKMIS